MKELNELVELAKEFDASTTVEAAMTVKSKFKATVTCETILAIAEAFRALEQRAEAAEAKLAEYEKQEPAFLLNVDSRDSEQYQFDIRAKLADGIHELFTRPAPAVSLAELVPDEMTLESYTGAVTESGHFQAVKWWNNCRAAILRNIEEAK